MADATIPVQNPSVSDSLLDAESLTVGVDTVKRERYQLAGSSALEIVAVTNAIPSATAYGAVVRPVGLIADNAAFTDGTTPVLGAGHIYDEVAGTGLAENDMGAARMNANRAAIMVLEDNTTRGNRVRALSTVPGATDIGLVVRPVGQLADNAAFTDGTTPVLPVGFTFDETAGTALTENDVAAARIDSKRAVVGVIEDATTRGQRLAVASDGSLLAKAAYTYGGTGQTTVTTAGTRVALAGSTACRRVTVKANAANTGLIYLGGSGVTNANGFLLSAKEFVEVEVANLSTLYIDSAQNGEGVSYIYWT